MVSWHDVFYYARYIDGVHVPQDTTTSDLTFSAYCLVQWAGHMLVHLNPVFFVSHDFVSGTYFTCLPLLYGSATGY